MFNSTHAKIMTFLIFSVSNISMANISATQWMNGSFQTTKPVQITLSF